MITSHVKKPTDCTQKPPVTNLRDIFQHHRNFQRHETFADRILIKKLYKAIGSFLLAKHLHGQINQLSVLFCCKVLQGKALSQPAQPCFYCVHINEASACHCNTRECKVLLFSFFHAREKGKKRI